MAIAIAIGSQGGDGQQKQFIHAYNYSLKDAPLHCNSDWACDDQPCENILY